MVQLNKMPLIPIKLMFILNHRSLLVALIFVHSFDIIYCQTYIEGFLNAETWLIGFHERTATMTYIPNKNHYKIECNLIEMDIIVGCPDWVNGTLRTQNEHVTLTLQLPLTNTNDFLDDVINTSNTSTVPMKTFTVHGIANLHGNIIIFDNNTLPTWSRHQQQKQQQQQISSFSSNDILAIDDQHSLNQAKHGIFLTSLLDPWVGQSIRQYGQWSEKELDLFKLILNEGDIMVDAGANIGAFTIPLAKHVGPYGKVFAFEAQRRIHHILSANIVLNNLMNVRNPHYALGQKMGSINVPNVNFTTKGNFGAVSLVDINYPKSHTHTIEKISLDEYFLNEWFIKGSEMEDDDGDRICPKLIKIDVEGMEENILRGFINGIKRCQPILYIENNCIKDSPNILKLLINELNYDVVWDLSPYYDRNNYKFSDLDIFHGLMSVNVIGVHQNYNNKVLKKTIFTNRTPVITNGSYYLKDYSYNISLQIHKDPHYIETLQTGTKEYCKR